MGVALLDLDDAEECDPVLRRVTNNRRAEGARQLELKVVDPFKGVEPPAKARGPVAARSIVGRDGRGGVDHVGHEGGVAAGGAVGIEIDESEADGGAGGAIGRRGAQALDVEADEDAGGGLGLG